MCDVLHKIAVYYDDRHIRQTIWAEMLKDKAVLAKARCLELYDESEQVRVAPRVPQNRAPHFVQHAALLNGRKLFKGESDPVHNKRVAELANALMALDELSLVFKPNLKADAPTSKLFSMPKYQWGTEVRRIVDEITIVRHDVYGNLGLQMSVLCPEIAIEVINTHYPEEPVFASLLRKTKKVPFIVLFDFTSHWNSFLRVDNDRKTLQIRPWTFYLRGGAVWKGSVKTSIDSSARLKLEVEAMIQRWKKK